jgi:hypothetical protein
MDAASGSPSEMRASNVIFDIFVSLHSEFVPSFTSEIQDYDGPNYYMYEGSPFVASSCK